jgi:hypothetical protein
MEIFFSFCVGAQTIQKACNNRRPNEKLKKEKGLPEYDWLPTTYSC